MLEKRLGRGAMGQVYLASDKKFATKKLAVKTVRQDILSSDDLQEGEAIARFEREAQAAASIQHPNTVSVTDFGETPDGVFYLVMEYVEGETLHRLLRREGTLPVKRAVNLLRQIADGVEAAHELGILHRDLKPANIFIMKGKHGDGFVKVGDFGLAKIVNQTVTDISSNATPSSRGIIGTPEFMSPEQMQPELGVDKRADLYALGTIAYLMLGGKTPFTGGPDAACDAKDNAQAAAALFASHGPSAGRRPRHHARARDRSERTAGVGFGLDEGARRRVRRRRGAKAFGPLTSDRHGACERRGLCQ
jgi:serine/threonine-protein kinase